MPNFNRLNQTPIFLKYFGHPLRTPEQRFQRNGGMKTEHPIRPLCEALEVSASGYYDWHHRQTHPSRRTRENAQLVQCIVRFHADSRQTYGSPRIRAALARAGNVMAVTGSPA